MSLAPFVTLSRVCIVLVPLIAGCSSFEVPDALDVTSKLNPYRIDIRQGNLFHPFADAVNGVGMLDGGEAVGDHDHRRLALQ